MKKTSMQISIDTEWESFSITKNFDPVYEGTDYTATVLTKNANGDTCWFIGRAPTIADALQILEENIARNRWHRREKLSEKKALSDMF